MKIGKLVQAAAPAILAYCERQDRSELLRLQDPQFSKKTFDITFPFCREVRKIGKEDSRRYYVEEHEVLGLRVRITSQWYAPPTSKSLPLLKSYLRARGLPDLPACMDAAAEDAVARPGKEVHRGAPARYRGHPIGNAQNALIRWMLSQLGEESFGADDWQAVLMAFDQACAYCGAKGALVRDHIIPINRRSLGEHRLGNLAPACPACNAAKGERDFRQVLKDQPERVAVLEAHMNRHGYQPLKETAEITAILDEARQGLATLAEQSLARLRSTLAEPGES